MQRLKSAQRQALRAKRIQLPFEERVVASERLASRVASTAFFKTSRRVACYFPNDGEIDPRPLMQRAWVRKKCCYLPVLSRLRDYLWFARVWPDTRFRCNRFGIPEPLVEQRELLRARDLDLILIPLVGFDLQGNRLGMGGGFYDRSLAFLRYRQHWKRPRLLGLAYDFQQVDILTADPWDIPMQAVVTDQAVYLPAKEIK
jgi:5-formyltetrahydrofolate cyclo-ligase